MHATIAVSSPPYYGNCRLLQTLDTSCSSSSSATAAAVLSRPRPSAEVLSFFGTRISLSRRVNQVSPAAVHRFRYGLRSVSRQQVIKAAATLDSAVELVSG